MYNTPYNALGKIAFAAGGPLVPEKIRMGNKGRWLGLQAEQIIGQNDIVYTVNFMLVEAVKDTWLSVATKELGWDAFYTKEQKYGAMERSIVVPQANIKDPHNFDFGMERTKFDPDQIEIGERFLIRIPPEPPVSIFTGEDDVINVEQYPDFEVKTYSGGGVGVGPLAAQIISISIKKPSTGMVKDYVYTGIGTGAAVGIVTPSEWSKVRLEPADILKESNLKIDADGFEGNGSVVSMGVGVSGTVFVFNEPNVKMVLDGWDIQAGFQADFIGYWNRLD